MAADYKNASYGQPAAPLTELVLFSPADVLEGNLLVAVVGFEFAGDPVVASTGWTVKDRVASNDLSWSVLWKRAGADEPDSWTFTWDGTSKRVKGWVWQFDGVEPTGDPFAAFIAYPWDFAPVVGSLSYNPTEGGLGVWGFGSYVDDATVTVPSGYTQRTHSSQVGAATLATRADAPGAQSTGEGATSAGANQRFHFAGTIRNATSTNTAPSVTVGADLEVESYELVNLEAVAVDAEGGVSYRWTTTHGQVDDPTSRVATWRAPLTNVPVDVTITCTVTDSGGLTDSDSVVAHVAGRTIFYNVEDGVAQPYGVPGPGD